MTELLKVLVWLFLFRKGSYNYGQKSWAKLTFVALFTRAKQIYLHLFSPSPPPPPPYNVEHMYMLSLQSFNIVLGGGGGATHFKTDNNAFYKFRFKNTEN